MCRYEQALQIRRDNLGPESVEVGQVLNNLGGVCFSNGNLDQALAHYNSALAIYQKALGDDEVRTNHVSNQ
jgi:tetratricopeptide (TPR) repeat protein